MPLMAADNGMRRGRRQTVPSCHRVFLSVLSIESFSPFFPSRAFLGIASRHGRLRSTTHTSRHQSTARVGIKWGDHGTLDARGDGAHHGLPLNPLPPAISRSDDAPPPLATLFVNHR
jgi:hypothetical protein